MARCISALLASATLPMTSSVAGLTFSNVALEWASTSSPSMSIRCSGWTVGVSLTPGSPSSGNDAADLEVDDGLHVEPEGLEDGVAVLVELGGPLRRGGLAVILERCGHQLELRAAGRRAVAQIAVGHGLGVVGRLEGVLDHGPLA